MQCLKAVLPYINSRDIITLLWRIYVGEEPERGGFLLISTPQYYFIGVILMSKKLTVIITLMAMILVFCVPVLAADIAADSHIIYGEQGVTKVYDGYIEELFTDNTMTPLRSQLIAYSFNNFYSTASTTGFYSSTGKIRIEYIHYASTNGTVTAKLVNRDNGAESQPITISGTADQTKITTLTWRQVPNGNWNVKFTLSPSAPSGNPWILHGEIYDD